MWYGGYYFQNRPHKDSPRRPWRCRKKNTKVTVALPDTIVVSGTASPDRRPWWTTQLVPLMEILRTDLVARVHQRHEVAGVEHRDAPCGKKNRMLPLVSRQHGPHTPDMPAMGGHFSAAG